MPPAGAKVMFPEASLHFCRQLHHDGEVATGRGHLQTTPLEILVTVDPIGSLQPKIACCPLTRLPLPVAGAITA